MSRTNHNDGKTSPTYLSTYTTLRYTGESLAKTHKTENLLQAGSTTQEATAKPVLLNIGNRCKPRQQNCTSQPAAPPSSPVDPTPPECPILQNRTSYEVPNMRKGRSEKSGRFPEQPFACTRLQDCATLRPLTSTSPSMRRKIQLYIHAQQY